MESQWWAVNIPCPYCKEELPVNRAEYNAKDGRRFFAFCPYCKKGCSWTPSRETLNHLAQSADIKASKEKAASLTKKKQQEDEEFLRKLRIKS
ncbi:MAG: hypothetical protein WC847_00570 [Candidatus Paceibacterota bacterium]|jgi:hypothetical protein